MREVITEPFTDNITIPVDFIGDYEIGALGIDSANNVLIADNLILNIEPPATLEAISANPDTVFIDVGDNAQLLVDGLFGDTITRDITAAARGTTYSSDNESIATVSANGKITGLAVGSANIRIANSGDNATVPVTVSQPQAALMCLIATDNITVLTDTDQLPLSAFITSGKDVDQSVQYWFMLSRPDGLTVLVNPVAPLTLAAHESWADNVTLTLPLTGAGWHTLTLLATNDNGSEAQATFDFVIEAPPITTTTIPATTTTTAASTTTAPVTTTIPVTSTVSITTTSVIFSTTTTVAGGSTTTTPATTTAASTTTAPATTTTADTSTTTPVTTTVPASTTSVISSTTTAPPGSTTTVPATSTTVPNSTTTTVEPGTTTTSVATATSTVIVSTSTTMPVTSTTTSTVSAGPCPAKKVLGENNPKLENLRNFRDGKLAHSAVGRRMIQVYYNHAGSINAALERSPALRAVTRRLLEIIAPMM